MTDAAPQAGRERIVIGAGDGHRIVTDCYAATGDESPRALVQVLHGLAEHAARYERFARHCAARGLAVVIHNHRGHGDACDPALLGHFADRDGWRKVVDDVRHVNRSARERFAGIPCALFGHSMGAYVAQAFVMAEPRAVDALLLSGSTSAPRLQLHLARIAALLESLLRGRRWHSPMLNAQAFGAFNERFAPTRTDFDWLSRDPAEVDRYVADPLCGWLATSKLWHDLLGGLLYIGRKSSLERVPGELPLLITGGSDDPVGGRTGMERLATRYRDTGHENVTLCVFDGGRHEMLNETNRDEFEAFVIEWIEGALGIAAAGRG